VLEVMGGTRPRASFSGQNYFAQVDGDEIRYGKQAMSPSQFANLRGSGKRERAPWQAPCSKAPFLNLRSGKLRRRLPPIHH